MMIGAKGQDLLRQFLGRDPHPSAGGKGIYHIGNPKFPGYRFEWHPQTRKLYVIRPSQSDGPVIAEIVAFDIETHGDAINAVNIWFRGFHEGRTPTIGKPHLQL